MSGRAEILIHNRTKIPFGVLAELTLCADSFVRLPRLTKVHLGFSWGKHTHGEARYWKNGRVVSARVRIARGMKHLTGVELAFSVFLVTVHELFHAREFLTGQLKVKEVAAARKRLRWYQRPHEQRAVIREGGAGLVVLMHREGTKSRHAIRALAGALYDLGIVFA